MTPGRTSGAVAWLACQAAVFGVVAALLGIAANTLFLAAYGPGWLPATYVAIGAAGIVVSGAIARVARTGDPRRIALGVLGSAAVAIALAWVVVIGAHAAWVSVPLLVLFPILIQLGFVFIGAQAGRLLDIDGIKAGFPRIMAGFPIGALVGGIAGGQLIAWLGSPEALLLAAAIAQAGFACLVWETGRRYPPRIAADSAPPAPAEPAAPTASRLGLRSSAGRFVVLIAGYQLLSALGSQLSDYLVFDRASDAYPDPTDLAAFLATYTAAMNAASIAFLVLVAGPLLRRYGLRLGIEANPLVLTAFAAAMIAVLVTTGGASVALLVVVSAARITDIALTDGTTRTSINALYQVLPEQSRLSVQAVVEGIGVPVAIAVSGVLVLLLNLLPFALAATILATALVCVVWLWLAVLLYRAYGPALVDAVRRPRLLDPSAAMDALAIDEGHLRRLFASGDPRAVRLGVEMLAATAVPVVRIELAELARDPRRDVRLSALEALLAAGDDAVRPRLAEETIAGASSPDPIVRRQAAHAAGSLDPMDRAAVRALLADPDIGVRSAALDAVREGDEYAVAPALDGLGVGATRPSAAGAIGRLGDDVVPVLGEMLDAATVPAPARVVRLVRAAPATSGVAAVLLRHAAHPDRELGLRILERLVASGPAAEPTADVVRRLIADDTDHAAHVAPALATLEAMAEHDADAAPGDEPLRRALADELELLRRRFIVGVLVVHGADRVGPAVRGLDAGGAPAALAREAFDVLLRPADAVAARALLDPMIPAAERRRRLPVPPDALPREIGEWLRELATDPERRWRSPWVRACAVHAARRRGIVDRLGLRMEDGDDDPTVEEERAAALTSRTTPGRRGRRSRNSSIPG